MSEVIEGQAEEAKVDDAKVEESQGQTSDDAEARRMGWLPEDEYKGDKSRWRDAKSFLERGKNEVPIMRERMKNLDHQVVELKNTLKEFAEFHTKVEQAAYTRAYEEIKAAQKAAVETADTDAFDRAEAKLQKLNESIPKAPQVKFDDKPNEVETEWLDKNEWAKDKEMYSFTVSVGRHMREMGNDKPLPEFLDDLAAEVKRLKPEKFTNKRRDEAPDVEGGRGMIRTKGKTFSDLDSEARVAGERFVKQGLFKSKDEYAKQYFSNLGE